GDDPPRLSLRVVPAPLEGRPDLLGVGARRDREAGPGAAEGMFLAALGERAAHGFGPFVLSLVAVEDSTARAPQFAGHQAAGGLEDLLNGDAGRREARPQVVQVRAFAVGVVTGCVGPPAVWLAEALAEQSKVAAAVA